ncbi:hypothetical protein TSAR_012100 [Trichomalopsis sarcophagae]|uniref:Uncharacterized protein n=1 Tax=Trichomalopsis sarcophagae TaxID=543379 RepID=A0A232EHN6_9HYME|nr:hypothetical protein TSAR_012100 [Trichomalopsis sarcophagae]
MYYGRVRDRLFSDEFEGPMKPCHIELFRCWNVVLHSFKLVHAVEQWLFFDEFEGSRKQCHKELFRCWNMIFDKNWHKLQFGVLKHQIILYIDCNRINILDTQPRGRIDVDGRICISKYTESDLTVPIDLQWMVLYCDPSRPERESCEEIQVSHTFNFMYNKDILLRSRSRKVFFSPGFQNTFGILLARGMNEGQE